MKTPHLVTALTLAIALTAASVPARAETEADMSFDGMVAMKHMDKNKDGMVSKKEFMEMMSHVWDMKAKKMNVKGDKMSTQEFKEILMYLKAGG